MATFRSLAINDRPRERLAKDGAGALSDVELLAVILGRGTAGRDLFRVAQEALHEIDRRNGCLSQRDLLGIRGIGAAQAGLIIAAMEFARRRIRPEGQKIREAQDIIPLVQHLADRKQEHFLCTSLNGAHEVIKTRVVTVGLLNSSQVHPREVFSDPIADRAAAVIVAHNHPSGDLTPSTEDIRVTEKLKAAGEILGIKLLDHVVFGVKGYVSFNERGLI